MARRAAALLALALALTACGSTRAPPARVIYRDVHVPVPYREPAPAALMACPGALPRPIFVPVPNGSGATSGLTPEGESQLRDLVERPLTCLDAWRAWAREEAP